MFISLLSRLSNSSNRSAFVATNRGISVKMTSPFARSFVANAPQPATADLPTLKKSFSNSAAGESLRVRCLSGFSIDILVSFSAGGDASSISVVSGITTERQGVSEITESSDVSEITERQSMA